jgi:HK97 family phage portal protein
MATFFERAIDWMEDRKTGPVTDKKYGPDPVYPDAATPEQIRLDLVTGANSAGEVVNRTTALQVSAVAACARVISQGMAQVSCRVMREDAKGSLVEAKNHALYMLLNRKPNDWQTSFEFREQIGLHLALNSNAYVFKNTIKSKVVELYAFPPENVVVKQNDDMSLSYQVTTNGRIMDVPAAEMWHIRGPSLNGICGDATIDRARRTVGLALATEKYGAKLFENGARPGGIITSKSDATPLTAEQRTQLKQMWSEQHQGTANAHKTLMLPFNLEFTEVSSTANDAQWIESRRFLIEEVCRFFGVQPIMVMQTGATSYASVEQMFLSHLVHTLMPWYERFEQSADANLLTEREIKDGYCVKLNGNALLRGSTAERTAYYTQMVTLGVMTVNEVRVREDMTMSDDPEANKLRAAANLLGNEPTTTPEPTPNQNEVSK